MCDAECWALCDGWGSYKLFQQNKQIKTNIICIYMYIYIYISATVSRTRSGVLWPKGPHCPLLVHLSFTCTYSSTGYFFAIIYVVILLVSYHNIMYICCKYYIPTYHHYYIFEYLCVYIYIYIFFFFL